MFYSSLSAFFHGFLMAVEFLPFKTNHTLLTFQHHVCCCSATKRGWQRRNFTGIPQPFKATPNPPQIRHDHQKNTADMKSPGQAQLTYCNPALGLEFVERIIPKRGVGHVIAAAWDDHEQYVGCHIFALTQ